MSERHQHRMPKNPKPKEWLAADHSLQYVADYKPFNFVDGEGVRCSIYVSGCLFNCPGCYNKAAQNFHYGQPYTQELEDQIMEDLGHDYVQGLTLLGGEPFLNTQVCLKVIKRLRKEYGHTKDIWSWSGYTWEELQKEKKKDILAIFAAHGSPYVAQVAPNKWKDMNKKIKTALDTEGPTFINALSACTTEWRFDCNNTVEMMDLAVDSLVFPLYEIINGHELHITYRPKNIIPVRDYLGVQGRFKHLFKPENEHIIEQWQKDVDKKWELLQRREEAKI